LEVEIRAGKKLGANASLSLKWISLPVPPGQW